MSIPIRLLVLSTLYPSSVQPIKGVFVETRLRELLKTGAVTAEVIAPVPWFPFRGKVFGRYGAFAATPRQEVRNGIKVRHPRYFLPPRVGMNIAPGMIARATISLVRRMLREGFAFDLIDAHYYYPDGVAAAMVAREFGKPFVVTARGTDLNYIPDFPRPRCRILETAAAAGASIGVSRALMDRLAALGAAPEKLHVLRNGVDLQRFEPLAQMQARKRLGMPENARLLLYVGHMIERKGQHIAVQALPLLPVDVQLAFVGDGSERERLERLARDQGVRDRVHFFGPVAQEELKWHYSAADALLLCSASEGWANVLLESMACGVPVIATDIAGTREVVSAPAAGVLMGERTPEALARSFGELFARLPQRPAVRAYAEQFSWDETSCGQLALFRRVLAAHQGAK